MPKHWMYSRGGYSTWGERDQRLWGKSRIRLLSWTISHDHNQWWSRLEGPNGLLLLLFSIFYGKLFWILLAPLFLIGHSHSNNPLHNKCIPNASLHSFDDNFIYVIYWQQTVEIDFLHLPHQKLWEFKLSIFSPLSVKRLKFSTVSHPSIILLNLLLIRSMMLAFILKYGIQNLDTIF